MVILINRTDAIGDTILTIIMAEFLRKMAATTKKTNLKIYFLVTELTAPLFESNPFIDGILIYPKRENSLKSRFLTLTHYFLTNGITHYLYVGGDHLPSFVARILRLPFVGGHHNSLKSFFFLKKKHRLRQKRSNVEKHEAIYNLELLSLLSDEFRLKFQDTILNQFSFTPITIKKEDEEKSKLFLQNYFQELALTGELSFPFLKTPYIILHPGMRGHTLNLSSQNYGKLILNILQQISPKTTLLVTYTKTDSAYITPLREFLKNSFQPIFIDGEKIGLKHYMVLVKNSLLFLGPSTGTTHLANALGVPVLSFYSPIKVQSVTRWAPFFKTIGDKKCNVITFVPPVNCPAQFHCLKEKCEFHPCMDRIDIQKIENAIIEFIPKDR